MSILTTRAFLGGSASLARAVKQNDILIKVDEHPCLGIALERLRALVLGPQGSHVTMELMRESSAGGQTIYYDIELVRGSPSFLKLLQRCHHLASDLDRMKNLLAMEQVKSQSVEAEKAELLARLEQGEPTSSATFRVSELTRELEEVRNECALLKDQLAEHAKKRHSLEQTLNTLQKTAASQAEEIRQLQMHDKDRLAWVQELERRRVSERDMNQTVLSQLQKDLNAGDAAREDAQAALVQAMSDSQLIRQEVAILRMREQNARARLEAGHRGLVHALEINDRLGLDLAMLLPESEKTLQFLEAALKSYPQHQSRTVPDATGEQPATQKHDQAGNVDGRQCSSQVAQGKSESESPVAGGLTAANPPLTMLETQGSLQHMIASAQLALSKQEQPLERALPSAITSPPHAVASARYAAERCGARATLETPWWCQQPATTTLGEGPETGRCADV